MSFPLGLGAYESSSLPLSAQRCVNLYAVIPDEQALNNAALFGTPGSSGFATTGSAPSRGAISMGGVYYVVAANTLYSINEFGISSALGTVSGAGRVSMAHNGEKLCIVVPGGSAYVWNATTSLLALITSANYRLSDTVCFKDGYYIFTETAGKVFFNSALNDPLTFDALDFGTAELGPDNIVGCHVNQDELFILGSETTEVFRNVGGAGFPFQRISGASFEKGAHSKFSPIQWEGSFYFIGGGRNEKSCIWRFGGSGEPSKISTDAIDNEIQKFTSGEIANAFSFTYSANGHAFIGFTIQSVNIASRTFVFNVTASQKAGRVVWFEMQSGIDQGSWLGASIDFVYDKLVVSSLKNGDILILDEDLYYENGEPIYRLKTTAPLTNTGKRIFVSEAEIVAEVGVGNITGQGSDPQIGMSYSDDGAKTWTSYFMRSLGAIGDYLHRTVWRRLGRVPSHRVFRFQIADPVKISLIRLDLEVTGE
jgi:hypothetical protein